jgi:EpsI family protein
LVAGGALMTGSDLARTLALCGCFIVAAVVLDHASQSEPVALRMPLASFPTEVEGWKSARSVEFDPKIVTILGVTDYLNRVYVREQDRAQAGLYVGYYKSQRQGESIHSPLNCLPGSGWQPIRSGRAIISIPSDASSSLAAPSIEVNRYVVQKGLDTLLVMYWYQSHGRVIASEYWGKFYLVADALTLNRTDAAMIRVMVPMADSAAADAADRTATHFVQAMVRLLGRHLAV